MEIAVSYQTFIPVVMPPRRPQRVSIVDPVHDEPGDSPRALQSWLKVKLEKSPRGTQKKLADFLHLQPADVSKIISGKRKVQGHEVMPIREFFERLEAAFPDVSGKGHSDKIMVIGYVGAGDRQHIYDVDESFLEPVDPPGRMDNGTVALAIRGDSLGPAFNGGHVFYNSDPSADVENLIGELCVIRVVGGATYIKTLERGREPGTFDLLSVHGEPIEGIQVESAAPVVAVTPRRGKFPPRFS